MKGFKGLSGTDKAFIIADYILVILVAIIVLYPLLYVLSASFDQSPSPSMTLIPAKFSLKGYEAVFNYKAVWTGYGNAVLYTVAGTFIGLVMTVAAAYPLSRRDFYGRNVFMALFVFTMYFSGGLIPLYLVVRDLKMLDTIWAIVLPGAISVYNMIVMRTFFSSQIPQELLEAAQIDGCGNLKFLWKVVLPISKSILAVIVLFYATGRWNSYFDALIFLKSASKAPLQIVLRTILIVNEIQAGTVEQMATEDLAAFQALRELMKYSMIIVSAVPMLIAYPFVQKHFVKGVMIGALKG
jgi:multiple sugar transport system permease protein/putative aldouronate transport system permease protein